MDERNFSIHLPLTGSVRMDLSGSVPSSQAISLAEGLGIQDVVVGKVSYAQDRDSKQVRLEAGLRVIRIGQGKSEFELQKAQSMEDLTNQEGALELARLVAPQLVNLLGGPRADAWRVVQVQDRAGLRSRPEMSARSRSICLPPSFHIGVNWKVFCVNSGKTCR